MEKRNFAFGRLNFILCGVAVALIVIGFMLMAGGGSSIEKGFDPEIFSTRRIVVAPMVALAGFVTMMVAILLPSKTENSEEGDHK